MRAIHAIDTLDDARLVELSRGGDREAFGRIVERYQSLICALTYTACGNLPASEDLAQVTFITAWCQLKTLREPNKLKSWLCRIARNVTTDSYRQRQRTPTANAEALEESANVPADAITPRDKVISREEQAILWRVLEGLPATYREPLVLFYRQEQSVAEVADALELSEDAVKQRLARGRAMLTEQVAQFVETTLSRTGPTQAFTMGVLAVLPAGPATMLGVGMSGKSSAAAKSGFLAAWVAPFIGIAAGVVAQCLIIRAITPDRKLRVKRTVQLIVGWIVLMGVAIAGPNAMLSLGHHFEWSNRTRFVAMAGFWWCYCMGLQTLAIVGFAHILGISQQNGKARETPRPAMTAMRPGTLAVVVAGAHLALFSWLVRLAWRADDLMAAATIAGMMVVLGISAFFNTRGKTGAALARAASAHMAVCGTVMLVTLNLRLDVWVASAYGVTVAEAHRLQPVWIVPLLTLAFLIWSGAVVALTKSENVARFLRKSAL
ncbi:MAG TPA: sigma-70 family RNA polymerase sigma factor [Verrucomicrobiae bacterium]|nr:sigma-70 family RNA polymerase sigma factor [Verrucomicrobiae bacterium]